MFGKNNESRSLVNANEVLLLTVIEDLSSSMSEHCEEIKMFRKKLKEGLCGNENTVAKTELAEVSFNDESKLIHNFSNVNNYNPKETDINCYGCTNTADALGRTFEMVKERRRFYSNDMNKKVYSPIVFLLSDGCYTCSKEEMDNVIKKYDDYKRSNGERKIKIWAATTDNNAAEQMSKYCDKVMVLRENDYSAYVDAIDVFAQSVNILSSSILQCDPITGEDKPVFDNPDSIVVGEKVEKIVSRKMEIEDMLG